ncbi:AT-hook motif nuclear-localized protein 10 isoform X1 [Amborella trichopoda]|uniref:AT-hook motif nuclear-localized protein 10 isoform X1 n=1 Tax=Amborella trichopoda TaxID=13333 RepID=UPI0005D3689E|nr:AT-hook motif nuclear-localized protein 10 isoform X1 [Amborella trichopoda]XP_011625424.1 AT-hook motif nuclear-localized protein 10 isoform X1 [Amborella trichopoda]XP_020526458.1 AT-hook motif nuclear-localized protein 10 isoform X1 [Amborella trichopoda]|eukprot:XP_011625423.1 AT-hook motif nuclear-localized protein 10 isoform X1 [Amborella trichopoda]
MEVREKSQIGASETGIMATRESYGVTLQKSSVQPPPPVAPNMRLAFSSDGAAVYKPVTGNSPPYQGDTSSTMVQHGGINMNMGEPLKRKRGRPRKYGPDGTMALALTPATPVSAGFPGSPSSSSLKKARGRPPGSGKKQQLAALGTPSPNLRSCLSWGAAGVGFMPHVITVKTGEDVASKIMSFSQQGPRAVCILSANGAISNVTLRQAATSGGTVTYEGRFEILSLSGSFLLSESGGQRSRTGGLSVSLAGPDGRVLGGGVAGLLMAATPVQVVVGSFISDGRKSDSKTPNQQDPSLAPSKLMGGAGTTGSPPSRGTLSESSGGGPGSPLNQSNNSNQPGVPNMPWK